MNGERLATVTRKAIFTVFNARLTRFFCQPGLIFLLFIVSVVNATEPEPLDFSFTQNHPGLLIDIGKFRLHVDCQGSGPVTVLFEPGLGGSSFEWKPIQKALETRARVCVYDRAGYAWSDRAPTTRDASHLAMDAQLLLSRIGVEGPLVLVGHSFGGYIIRLLASRVASQMLGMVLVDASHEDQLKRLEKINGTNMMPRGRNFVVSPVDIPESLPEEIRRKIAAFSRMRKTYAALHAEMGYFRESAEQVRRAREVVEFPVVVVRRGDDLYGEVNSGSLKTQIWKELQEDLSEISTDGRVVIAENSGHHIHADKPDLIVQIISDMIGNYESGSDTRSR